MAVMAWFAPVTINMYIAATTLFPATLNPHMLA
jgi:hypothetical protein